MKKLISLIMISCIILGTVLFGNVPVLAIETEDETAPSQVMVDVEIDYTSAQYNDNGTVYYDILNVEEVAEAWGVTPEKVRQMKFLSVAEQENDSENYGVSPAGLFSRIEIHNVALKGNSCMMQIIIDEYVQNYSSATVTRTKEISATISHTYTTSLQAGIEVDGATLSSALGFNIVESVTVTDTISVDLGPGEAVEVIAVPLCQVYEFDVYQWKLLQGTNYVGEGIAYQVIGFCVTVMDR